MSRYDGGLEMAIGQAAAMIERMQDLREECYTYHTSLPLLDLFPSA